MTTQLNVGNVNIVCDEGLLTFVDPNRETPVQIKVEDISLLLDFLDSVDWDRRRAFRVPLSKSRALYVDITWHEMTYPVTPLDVSLTGILVEFDHRLAPDLAIDDSVGVTLKLGEVSASLMGTIKRRTGYGRYGIFFSGAVSGQRVDPPIALLSIVSQLETQWLLQRIYGRFETGLEGTPSACESERFLAFP
jgi:hypothetical protein